MASRAATQLPRLDGKGLAFAQANKNTWGKGDYEDCMTGVDAMIANGIADPDRLGAFGWSYGVT